MHSRLCRLSGPTDRLLVTLVAVLAAVNLLSGLPTAVRHSLDLQNLLVEARLILAGHNPYSIFLTKQAPPGAERILEETAAAREGRFSPDYFPSSLLPLYPLATLSLPAARIIWLVLNLASCVAFVAMLHHLWPARSHSPRDFAVAVLVWAAGSPFRTNLAWGQLCTIALVLVLAAHQAHAQGRPFLAGLLLTLGLAKYAYVWPFVLFFFVFNRDWKPLLVAGGAHGLSHLALSWHIGAHPFGVLVQVLRVDSKIFHRDTWLTFWTPFRALEQLLPGLDLPSNVLGGLLFLAVTAWLAWLWATGGRDSGVQTLGWLYMLGNLTLLSLALKWYYLVTLLPGWLWCLALPQTAETRYRRPIILGCMVYLAVIHRLLLEAAGRWLGAEVAEPLHFFVFNSVLALLCISSGRLFHLTSRPLTEKRSVPTVV